ncbi:MAG: hypothetical protein JSS56_24400, partial [Proteobacteria bacterium]|nr:hypothetical protein [Pseudomonadota bacterium]
MKRIDMLAKSATACAVLLLVAACGGGGGSSTPGTTTAKSEPSVQLSGTAATGAALANASVAVKCANAEGTATTDASGKYSLQLTGGALPCVIQVTGEQGGVAVTLHSLAEAGSTDSASGTTSAAANVTPLTEMIVAQLSAGLPSDLFAAFGSGQTVSTEQLVAATNAVLTAIKDATGIDLGTIDPFKAPLVAATAGAPSGGNLYDNLLDQLGTKVSIEALPQVVNQIANAAGSGGGTAGLGEVMQSVQKGPLAGCPVAASGTYRTIDHYGRMTVRDFDFSAMTYASADGKASLTVSADPAKPCEFTADGTQQTASGTEQVHFDFAMGSSGLGVYRSQNNTTGRTSVGYVFPVQSHAKSELAGTWSMLQSGYAPSDGFFHWMEQMTFKADDKIDLCDIDFRNAPGTCVAEPDANISLAARTDGGFDVIGVENGVSGPVANMFAYRSPTGAVNVFGTTNPDGNRNVAGGPEIEETHFILTKHQTLAVPAVDTVSKYFDVQLSRLPVSGSQNVTSAPVADSNKVTSVNGNAVTRQRASDGRVDTVHYNDPMAGVRHRDAGIGPDNQPFAEVYQVTVPGAGLTVSINAQPA